MAQTDTPRAILTDREREIIAGEGDTSDSYRYQTISRVRRRFDRLDGDLEAFAAHGDLLDEFRAAVCGGDPEPDPDPGPEPDAEPEAADQSASSAPEDVETALDGLGLGDERTAAVRAMYGYLRENGSARKSDFVGDVFPDHPAGYGSPGGWWNRLGKAALADLPGVEKPAEGRPTWRYTGNQ